MSLIFQLLDIRTYDISYNDYNKSLIQLFGKTLNNKSVYIEVDNYKSCFYTNALEEEITNLLTKEIIKLENKIKTIKDSKDRRKIINKKETLNNYLNILTITENLEYKEFYYFNLNKVKVSKIECNSIKALKYLSILLFDNNYKVYESNKDTILQFIHNRRIKSCGWVEIQNKNLYDLHNYYYVKEYKKGEEIIKKDIIIKANEGYCKINKSCNYEDIHPAKSEYDLLMAPFILCAYDIEAVSEDNGFPQFNRETDKIVSIACTFNKINEPCYKKVCIMLYEQQNKLSLSKYGDNYKIITCLTELDLLKSYFNLIQQEDPDIITGWNNFVFDDHYIYERLIRLTNIRKWENNIKTFIENDSDDDEEEPGGETSCLKGDDVPLEQEQQEQDEITLLDDIYKNKILSQVKKGDKKMTTSISKLNYLELKELQEKININLSRFNEQTQFITKKMVSAQMGDNIMNYFDMKGRVCYDMMKLIRRERSYISYKLDYVSSQMFRYIIKSYKLDNNNTIITINNYEMHELHNDQYVMIIRNDGTADYECFDENKFRIKILNETDILINTKLNLEEFKSKGKYYICNVKDDVKPKEIFEKYKSQKDYELEQLALYNIQDCELCNNMANKLFTIINYVGMANVCYIPLNWIFNRGQSQKVFSLVSKKCQEEGYIIRTVKKEKEIEDNITYEGAIVVKPNPNIYPAIFCLDYSSLYPSSIIAMNISHETYINNKDLLLDIKNNYSDKYDIIKVDYIPYDEEMIKLKKKKENKKYKGIYKVVKIIDEKKVHFQEKNDLKECYFIRRKDGVKGLLPQILEGLLGNRRAVRKESEKYKESDPFKYKVLDGLQLAYKITCNSVYGQLGCNEQIGPIALLDIAACTTATGRKMMLTAQHFARDILPNIIEYGLTNKQKMYDYLENILPELIKKQPIKEERIKIYDNYRKQIRDIFLYKTKEGKLKRLYNYKFEIVYGDTDSIFVGMNLTYKNDINYENDLDEKYKQETKYYIEYHNDKTKSNIIYISGNHKKDELVNDLELRVVYMKTGMIASKIISGLLPPPENLEYEKVLSPLIIMSKKRYVGNLYEFDPKKYFQKNMGFVLKRRDNARIVKYIIGGLVDRLLNTSNLLQGEELAYKFVKKELNNMLEGKFNIKLFILSKSLKRDYKDRTRIVHAVLADRIAERDPGNAPAPNDRIDYIYYALSYEPKLQGERVETPEYIISHNLKIDYNFYLTNQILKPCQQIMELFKPDIDKFFKNICYKSLLQKKGIHQLTLKDCRDLLK